MRNNYKIVCGKYDTFAIDYDIRKEIRCATRYNTQGFAEVKKIVGHSLSYCRNSKTWNSYCPDCGKFWIVEKI